MVAVMRLHSNRRGCQHIAAIATGVLFVSGLVATSALPAFASDLSEGEPQPTASAGSQRLSVDADVTSPAVTRDLWSPDAAAGWVAPVRGELRDGFGPRFVRPVAGVSGMHRGQDLGAACGERVRAASGGTVVQAGWYGSYGNWVLIDHGNGVTTGYAHNSRLLVRVGTRVTTGQVIAAAGTTGASSGCHVHLEVRAGAAALEPVGFLRQRGVRLG